VSPVPRVFSALTVLAACAVLALAAAPALAAPKRSPLTAAEAELWLTAPGNSRDRERTIAEWAKGAPLDDLLWMLRLPSTTLAGAEASIVDAALQQAPPERDQLRQRLLARRALAAGRPARRTEPPLPRLDQLRPWASVWHLAAILPNKGEYAAYASAVRVAIAEGLSYERPPGAHPIELDTLATGDSDPSLVAEAFEKARRNSDVIVGELLSSPTIALATAVRATGQVLVSPTATDERIGRVGPHVVQVGPGARARAQMLADVVLGGAPHVVVICGSASGIRSAFADAFAAEVTDRGGRIARREALRTSSGEIATQARAFKESGANILFWDGPPRSAEALLQALASQGASVRLCGGPALAPEGMRPAAQALLEGVAWVGEDWQLPIPVRVRLDSLAAASGLRSGAFWTQGWLAGRAIALAIDRGARSAEEVTRELRAPEAGGLASARILGASLPVFVMSGGRPVAGVRLPRKLN
jgi:ABC-type branched-subunit amino acid transport system substrate-binding protein